MMSPKSTRKTPLAGFSSDPELQAIITSPPIPVPTTPPLSDATSKTTNHPSSPPTVNHSVVSPLTTSSRVGVGQAPADRNGHAHAHDDDLFEETVKEYSLPLHRYVSNLKMSLNYDDTWDIVQRTFIEASRRWDIVKAYSEEHRRKWLYRVARNKAHDYFRHLQSRFHLWERCCEKHSTGEAQAGLTTEDYEKAKNVHQALRELSARERDCFLLTLEGFKQKEIAEMLKIKENSVSSHLSRGRQKLRQLDLSLVNTPDTDERRS